jgi:hypothetical protein
VQAELAAGASPPTLEDAVTAIAGSLGWRQEQSFRHIAEYTVKWGTLQQMGPVHTRRVEKWQRFATLAAPDSEAQAVWDMIKRCWRIKWENANKEVLWLLSVDGVPVATRMGGAQSTAKPCGCGALLPDRGHHYWDCHAAAAVLAAIAEQLQGEWHLTVAHLQRPHIWLGERPAAVHQGVWDVTCLAALNAMDTARCYMVRQQLAGTSQPGPDLLQLSSQMAVTKFWALLSNFAGLGLVPAGWPAVPEGHPFLEGAEGTHTLRVRRTAPTSIG